jgi:hypothetical protein
MAGHSVHRRVSALVSLAIHVLLLHEEERRGTWIPGSADKYAVRASLTGLPGMTNVVHPSWKIVREQAGRQLSSLRRSALFRRNRNNGCVGRRARRIRAGRPIGKRVAE